jgi:hypothetical protein
MPNIPKEAIRAYLDAENAWLHNKEIKATSANIRLLVAIAIQLSQLDVVAGCISKRFLAHTINTNTGIPINAVLKKKCW